MKLFDTIQVNPFALSDNHLYTIMNGNNDINIVPDEEEISILRKIIRRTIPYSIRKRFRNK